MKLDRKQCKLIAHRGLSAFAPENTMAAFQLAGKHDYYGIESDIQTTKDGHFVMFHDGTLERMTGREGDVKNYTLDEVQQMPMISGSNITNYPNEMMPSLQDYLNLCFDFGKVPIAEVKYVNKDSDLDRIVEIIKSSHLYSLTTVISFNIYYLIYLREHYPDLKIQFLVTEITNEVIQCCIDYHFDIDVSHSKLTKDHIECCHEARIKVNVWTVDDFNRAQELIDWGVDYITTNRLE